MALHDHIEDAVHVETCKNGELTDHKVSLSWQPDYESGIRIITEPYFHEEALDYEVFADITVMEMTVNHIMELLENAPPTLGRWLMPENMVSKRLVVTDVIP